MNKVKLDFNIIGNKELLYDFIEQNFELEPIAGGGGRNLDAFWDCYSYSKEIKEIMIINIKEIKDISFQEYIKNFIKLLSDFEKTNYDFKYNIKD